MPKFEGDGVLLRSTCPVCGIVQEIWMRPTEAGEVLAVTADPARFADALRRAQRRLIQ